MHNFISLILLEITDKLNCKLINAWYFNLKLNVYSNPLSVYFHVKMTNMTYLIYMFYIPSKVKSVVGAGKSRALK